MPAAPKIRQSPILLLLCLEQQPSFSGLGPLAALPLLAGRIRLHEVKKSRTLVSVVFTKLREVDAPITNIRV